MLFFCHKSHLLTKISHLLFEICNTSTQFFYGLVFRSKKRIKHLCLIHQVFILNDLFSYNCFTIY